MNVYFCLFVIFSFLGWSIEVLYSVIKKHKLINRGFLFGPFCPIYGIGIIIIYFISNLFINAFKLTSNQYILSLFFLIILLTSMLEFFTGLILEKIFHTRWWDYSNKFLNINGYICFSFAIIWGVLGIILFYFIKNNLYLLKLLLLKNFSNSIILILLTYFSIDFLITFKYLIDFKYLVIEFEEYTHRFNQHRINIKENFDIEMLKNKHENSSLIKSIVKQNMKFSEIKQSINDFKSHYFSFDSKSETAEKLKQYTNSINKISKARFLQAFPDMKFNFKHFKNKKNNRK